MPIKDIKVKDKPVFSPEFIPINVKAMKDFKLTYTEALVHGFIKYYFSFGDQETKSFYFTNKQLATIIGKKPRVVSEAISKLKKIGIINVDLKFRDDGGNIRFIVPNNIKLHQTTHSTGVLHPPSTTVLHPLALECEERENTKEEYINDNKLTPTGILPGKESVDVSFVCLPVDKNTNNSNWGDELANPPAIDDFPPKDGYIGQKLFLSLEDQFDMFIVKFNKLFHSKHVPTGGVEFLFRQSLKSFTFEEIISSLESVEPYWEEDDSEPMTPYSFLSNHLDSCVEKLENIDK